METQLAPIKGSAIFLPSGFRSSSEFLSSCLVCYPSLLLMQIVKEDSLCISLMSFKFHCDSCCFDARLSKELLTDAKKATYK